MEVRKSRVRECCMCMCAHTHTCAHAHMAAAAGAEGSAGKVVLGVLGVEGQGL